MSRITTINSQAFYNCPSLLAVTLPPSLSQISINSFDSNSDLLYETTLNGSVSLTVVALSAVASVSVPPTLSFDELTGLLTGSIEGYGDHVFSLTNDLNDVITINFFVSLPPDSSACFLSHSRILMGDCSYREIKDIKKGDFVISAFTNLPVEVLHCGKTSNKLSSLYQTNLPVCIPVDFFCKDKPFETVFLSGHHRILINAHSAILGVPAHRFVGTVKKTCVEDVVDYFHLELKSAITDGVFTSGIAVEALEHGDWEKFGFIEN